MVVASGKNRLASRRCVPWVVRLGWLLLLCLPSSAWSQTNERALGLLDLYQTAKGSDARLRAAEAGYQAALMNRPIARASLLPQINFSATHNRWNDQKISGAFFRGDANERNNDNPGRKSDRFDYGSSQWSLSLSQTLFNVQQYIRFKKSRSESEQAELRYAVEQQGLIVRLAESYFAVLTSEKTVEFATAEKDAVNQQLQQARERFEVGLAAITDVKEAEAAYDLSLAEEIEALNELDNKRYALAVIVNYDVERIFPLEQALSIRNPEPQNLEAWVRTALNNNLELLVEQMELNLARQSVREQSAGYFPTLDLFAERSSDDVRGGPSPRESYETIYGVKFSAPLFSGGSTYYQTRKADQAYRQAVENLELKRRETKRAVRQSYLDVLSSVKRAEALARAQESAEVSLQSNRAGFDVGTRTSVDVLLALRELFRARLNYESLRHEYVVNSLKLKQVSGSLSETDLVEINNWLDEQAE